jgi:hypothetical protein
MAQGTIEHSELPDELLHEPKGASTAAAGTVYIADGAGSGSFTKLPTSSLDITAANIVDITPSSIDETVALDGAALAQVADGTLTDIQAFVGIPQEITSKINENAAELLRLYNNQATINQQVSNSIAILETKLNEVIVALKGVGIVND